MLKWDFIAPFLSRASIHHVDHFIVVVFVVVVAAVDLYIVIQRVNTGGERTSVVVDAEGVKDVDEGGDKGKERGRCVQVVMTDVLRLRYDGCMCL